MKRQHKISLCHACEALIRSRGLRISLPTRARWEPTPIQAGYIKKHWGTVAIKTLANFCNTTEAVINSYGKRMNYPSPQKNFKHLHAAWVKEYQSNPNETFQSLADRWGVSLSTIKNAMSEQGVYGRGSLKTKPKMARVSPSMEEIHSELVQERMERDPDWERETDEKP